MSPHPHLECNIIGVTHETNFVIYNYQLSPCVFSYIIIFISAITDIIFTKPPAGPPRGGPAGRYAKIIFVMAEIKKNDGHY